MVKIMIPMVSPCFSIHGKKVFNGVTRTMIRTKMEIATLAKNSKPAYFTRKRDGRQALLKKLSIFGHLPDVSPPVAG
ncbi:Uncharacterised protein [Enterobacter cloacae]|nr:Uncharacterised protein [Enterobacter cloacae]